MSTSVTLELVDDSDNTLSVTINAPIAGTDLSGATVAVTLLDSSSAEVSGETWPLSLAFVSGTTSALFRGNLADTLSVSAGDALTAVIVADNGAGQKRTFRRSVNVVTG